MSFISVTSTVVPRSKKMFEALNIPYGVVVHPNLDIELPRVQFPIDSIVRCSYCNSYISKYSQVDIDLKLWKCVLCGYENKISESYAQILNFNSPELNCQNYEIYAELKYMERPPMCPCYFFLLDLSEESVNSGFLSSVCDCILNTIKEKSFHEEKPLFGLSLFGKMVHLINIFPVFQVFSFPASLSEPWLPCPSDLVLLDLSENHQNIISALQHIKNLKGEGIGTAFKRSLKIAQLLLEPVGGKILTFLYNPSRDSAHPKKLSFLPSTDFYHKLGEEFVEQHISVDVFIGGTRYCGLNNYTELAKLTGGECFYYKDYCLKSNESLQSDLNRVVLSTKGWESMLRLRTSEDWKIYNSYGNFLLTKDLCHMACYQNLSFTFDLGPRFAENTENYLTFQASLLYTSTDRIRVVRVMNYQVSVDDNADEVLKSINCEVLVNLYFKHAIGLALKRHVILAAQRHLENKAIDVVKNCLVAFDTIPRNLFDFLPRVHGLIRHQIFENSHIPCNSK